MSDDPVLRVEQGGDGAVTLSLPKVDVRLTTRDLARCVAELDEHGQARFLADLARAFRGFEGSMGWHWQASQAGAALGFRKDGAEAVELVRALLEAAEEALTGSVMGS